jgi:hypothetical protein
MGPPLLLEILGSEADRHDLVIVSKMENTLS